MQLTVIAIADMNNGSVSVNNNYSIRSSIGASDSLFALQLNGNGELVKVMK